MSKPIIAVNDVSKIFLMGKETVIALKAINLEFYEGRIYCIVGTSGSGKSTLLNMLAGLEKPTRGNIIYFNKDNIVKMGESKLAKFRRHNIGFVFQSYNLLNQLTAWENVAMPLTFRGYSTRMRRRAAKVMLHKVGLGDSAKHLPTQMSGGQQQRTSIARAFVSQPQIVFADEPTGNLDTKTSIEVMELITGMARKLGQTLIIVTHDKETADYADTVITMRDGIILDITHKSEVNNEQ